MLCHMPACIPPHPWEGGTHRACETIRLWVPLQLGEGMVCLPLASNEGWCSRRRIFSTLVPGSGSFQLSGIAGLG